MRSELFTVGHSNQEASRLLELLHKHQIQAVADVRSSPHSRFNPQFDRTAIQKLLATSGIEYVFLGAELGARPSDSSCYENGVVQFSRLRKTELFLQGLQRVLQGIQKYRLALMCAEKDPLDCHRMVLVCRALRSDALQIAHILEDGGLESNGDAERRLVQRVGLPERDLFRDFANLVEDAYELRGRQIAYVTPGSQSDAPSWREVGE